MKLQLRPGWRIYAAIREVVWWLEGPKFEQWMRRPEWLRVWAYREGKRLERLCTERTGRTIYGRVWR